MCCDNQVHQSLIKMEEFTCPFCEQLLEDGDKSVEQCCDEQDIKNVTGPNVCINCGSVHSSVYENEYIDFYENMHRIRQSIYQRKYHIDNVLNDLCCRNNVQLTWRQRDKVFKIFKVIGPVLSSVNGKRKRMISTKFIIKEIFMMLGIPFEHITVSKSGKTLKFYERYWTKILLLCFDKIINIIKH